jgi:maleate isomerase
MARPETTGATRPARIGMIVPSSNTCLEPMTYRMLGDREDVTVHSARIPVTRIALDGDSDRQFDTTTMLGAAELLATADVDVIAWNGTSGSWLGPEHDHEVTDAITQHTGIPATTSTLAYLDAFERFRITTVGLLTPYTPDVNSAVAERYSTLGLRVTSDIHLDLSDNESFARVPPDDLLHGAATLAAEHPDAVVVLCTNVFGAPIAERLEADTGVPLLDSVAVTLWKCLDLSGARGLDQRWGKLLS